MTRSFIFVAGCAAEVRAAVRAVSPTIAGARRQIRNNDFSGFIFVSAPAERSGDGILDRLEFRLQAAGRVNAEPRTKRFFWSAPAELSGDGALDRLEFRL
jgi:hypothetical protein